MIYSINKGINKSVEFKGLRAQYIGYLAGGLVFLLLAFMGLYLAGVNTYVCMALVLGAGTALVAYVFKMSHKYGRYGLMKKRARRQLPDYLCFRSRKTFSRLCR